MIMCHTCTYINCINIYYVHCRKWTEFLPMNLNFIKDPEVTLNCKLMRYKTS